MEQHQQTPDKQQPTYRRPGIQRPHRRSAPPYSHDRFLLEVLSGRLWHAPCQAAARSYMVDQIPLTFSSIDEYISTFDSLVLEEACEGLKADWAESCAEGRTWAVHVIRVQEQKDRWWYLDFHWAGALPQDVDRFFDSQEPVVVLTLQPPPQQGAADWAQLPHGLANRSKQDRNGDGTPSNNNTSDEGGIEAASIDNGIEERPNKRVKGTEDIEDDSFVSNPVSDGATAAAVCGQCGRGIVAGMVMKSYRGKDGSYRLKIHPSCSHHSQGEEGGGMPPCCEVLQLLRSKRKWWLTQAKTLTSSDREFEALHKVRDMDPRLLRHVLQPRLLEEIGQYYQNPLVRQGRWPKTLRNSKFLDFLRGTFDHTQLEAIEMAACHLSNTTSLAAVPYSTQSQPPPTLPFILVQGPPGTGKTHAVRGILNIWHATAYQHYYDEMLAYVRHLATHYQQAHGSVPGGFALGDQMREMSAQKKPRILVCTPSNASVDEIVDRIMQTGFMGADGGMYPPRLVRVVGRGVNVFPSIQSVVLANKVAGWMNMTQQQWQRGVEDVQRRLPATFREIRGLEAAYINAGDDAMREQIAVRLCRLVEEEQRLRYKESRFEAVRQYLWGNKTGRSERMTRKELEMSLMLEAEMIFTTLSTSRSPTIEGLAARYPFHTVLIDEAGQATEVATLQPLIMGAQRAVLVGDPQQLPATILSEAAKAVALERSLFERLQSQGCPVTMLTVQYRMHKEIRSFPSRHFYNDALRDAVAVQRLPDEVFYGHDLLKPYVVFDVAKGVEERSNGAGGSLSNKAEAEMAVALVLALRAYMHQHPPPGTATNLQQQQQQLGSIQLDSNGASSSLSLSAAGDGSQQPRPHLPSVAVVTPYRAQLRTLRDTFRRLAGPQIASEVTIATIDSYQGRQMDVIILSCVRAGVNSGLGFVKDVRRLNVAITRARRALWVLGSVATLRHSLEWNALISDAEERRRVVHDAHAQDLFPELDCWKPEAQQAQQQKVQPRRGGDVDEEEWYGEQDGEESEGGVEERRKNGGFDRRGGRNERPQQAQQQQQRPNTAAVPSSSTHKYPTAPDRR